MIGPIAHFCNFSSEQPTHAVQISLFVWEPLNRLFIRGTSAQKPARTDDFTEEAFTRRIKMDEIDFFIVLHVRVRAFCKNMEASGPVKRYLHSGGEVMLDTAEQGST